MFTIKHPIDPTVEMTLHEARETLAECVNALSDPNDDDAGIEESMMIVSIIVAAHLVGSVFIAPPLDGTRKRQLERAYSFIEQAREALNEGDDDDGLLNELVEQIDTIQDRLNDEIGD
jgi:hypothetical protein